MGQADLSPHRWVSWVLSDAKITGAIVAPSGRWVLSKSSKSADLILLDQLPSTYVHVPPPISSPHLIDDAVTTVFSGIETFWGKLHLILKCQVPNQFTDTVNRISEPEFQFVCLCMPITVFYVAGQCDTFTLPVYTTRQPINRIQQLGLVLE